MAHAYRVVSILWQMLWSRSCSDSICTFMCSGETIERRKKVMNKKSVPALMCFHLLELLGSMSRFGKRFISVIADILMISLAFWGGYWVRLDDAFPITSIKHWVLLLALSCLLYTSPSPRDRTRSRMPSSA